MNCPVCEFENYTKVIDSRSTDNGIERVRECIHCLTRFKTIEKFERIVPPKPWRKRKNYGQI